MAGLLEAPVERLLDIFPERPAIRAHDHAAAYRGIIGQLGALDDLVVPFGEINILWGEFFFGHLMTPVRFIICRSGGRIFQNK